MYLQEQNAQATALSRPTIPTPRQNNQASDCDSAEVHTWIDQTGLRLNELDSDLDYLANYSSRSFDDYAFYAESAKQRYYAQLSQSTPGCLDGFQEIVLEKHRLFWKGLDSAANGDFDSMREYFYRLIELNALIEQAFQEIEKNNFLYHFRAVGSRRGFGY